MSAIGPKQTPSAGRALCGKGRGPLIPVAQITQFDALSATVEWCDPQRTFANTLAALTYVPA